MKIERIEPQIWSSLSENAHKIAFNTLKPASQDRISFALLAVNDANIPLGYVTCREHDADTLYWQFGGAFPGTIGTTISFPTYCQFVEWCKPHYKRITTLIENTNTVMLKMAMKVGFRIIGVRFYKGSILLEHVLEFANA